MKITKDMISDITSIGHNEHGVTEVLRQVDELIEETEKP